MTDGVNIYVGSKIYERGISLERANEVRLELIKEGRKVIRILTPDEARQEGLDY